MTDFDSVGEFHRKFGLPVAGVIPLDVIDDESFLFRYQFLLEELQELIQAHRDRDLVGVADALADLVYVALGTAHMYGIPFDEVFAEVQRANLSKERTSGSTDRRSKRGSDLDVVKPEGWRPPDISDVLSQKEDRDREAECETFRQGSDAVRVPEETNPKDVQPPRGSYEELCSACKIARVYKHNTSRVCPDCAADKRIEENQAKGFLE